MNSLVAVASVAVSVLGIGASIAGSASHDLYFQRVATYRAAQGFNHVVAGTRFTGFFLPTARGTCAVSLILSDADDESLRRRPQRLHFELTATQGVDVTAGEHEAIGLACTADGDALKVARLTRTAARTAQGE